MTTYKRPTTIGPKLLAYKHLDPYKTKNKP